jgi:EAL domain-containing protein (putative c-di-GMP-specific phosphodiesterase class I)
MSALPVPYCGTARASVCTGCGPGEALARRLRMAFQPIFVSGPGGWSAFAFEALARGPAGEPAGEVLGALRESTDPHLLDLACRLAGLRDAAALDLHRGHALLSLNVLPTAALNPATCLGATLRAAHRFGFPPGRILFEITEVEQVRDIALLRETIAVQRAHGVSVALDDFGAGYSGLGLLVEVRPDIVKLDTTLLRGIDRDPTRARIVGAITEACHSLGIIVIAEGVETHAELHALRSLGIRHFQGYLLGRPALGVVPACVPAGDAVPLPRELTAAPASGSGAGETLTHPSRVRRSRVVIGMAAARRRAASA